MGLKPSGLDLGSIRGGCYGSGARFLKTEGGSYLLKDDDRGLGFRLTRLSSPLERLSDAWSVK